MRIGIISDTHDNLPAVERAVNFFNKQKVSFVLHAGDYVAPFTIAYINKLFCDWRGVFGNNDGEQNGLTRASAGRIIGGILRVELSGKKIVMAHDRAMIDLKKEKADIIICGHTHKPEISYLSNRPVINPGEACGWLSAKSTVAIADLEMVTAKIYTI
jgi:uncharacterized protein